VRINGRGYGHDEKRGAFEVFGIVRKSNVAPIEVSRAQLAARVNAFAHHGDAFGADVETNHFHLAGKGQGNGQPYVAQADHR
jgi:hypothetical protein